MKITVNVKKFVLFLSLFVIFLAFSSLTGQYYKYFIGHERYIINFFDLDKEWNLPSYYSSFTLLLCSILLFVISESKRQNNNRYFSWLLLCIIFFFMAIDEAMQLHEMTILPLRTLFKLKGIFYFSWVIPGIILVIFLSIIFYRLILSLDSKFKLLFVSSGLLYISGAIGMELIGGYYAYRYGQNNFIYALVSNIEEIFEMIGILFFLYSLLSYINFYIKSLNIIVSDHPIIGSFEASICNTDGNRRFIQ